MAKDELLPPIRTAVQELLAVLEGTILPKRCDVARCFVVAGERGTGKTTVLMTAAAHCRPKPLAGVDACGLADCVRWLDILDVQPMRPSANFLTTLLIAVRRVLDPVDGTRRASLLEDWASSAREKLDRLINDSALVWEEIEEPTTRERAHRQVAAAESYLDFRQRLTDALAEVGKALAKRESGRSEGYVLVLPIDNIDRSAEHLSAIFKLAQLVTCEHLVLVLAGDRAELNLFLERAYLKEITSGSANAKVGDARPDDALAIARRQAAATIRKILPPTNRIEIKSVAAKDSLEFAVGAPKLRKLLEGIEIQPKTVAVDDWEPASLLELLTLDERRLPGTEFSEIGKSALQLPARGLLDFWLLCHREARRGQSSSTTAIRIVRSMLRLVAAESNLPHWADELLQNEIVIRFDDDGTRLVIGKRGKDPHVRLGRLRSLDRTYTRACPEEARPLFDSAMIDLHLRHEFMMSIIDGERTVDLAQSTSAWFLLLHDLLMYSPDPLVINSTNDFLDDCGPSVVTRWSAWQLHEPLQLALRWPRPRWAAVFDHVVMDLAWKQRLLAIDESSLAEDEPAPQWLAASWIELVTWVGTKGRTPWKPKPDEPRLADYVERVLRDAAGLLGSNQTTYKPTTATDIRRHVAAEWVAHELPSFFTGELSTGLRLDQVPMPLRRAWKEHERTIARQRATVFRNAVRRALASRASKPDPATFEATLDRVAFALAKAFDSLDSPLSPLLAPADPAKG